MPIANYKSVQDVEVEIYNLKEELLGRYNAICSSKKWVAFYYGYSITDASRLSAIEAFKCAVNDMKKQIDSDSARLIWEFNE